MRRRHSKADILEAALDVARTDGLGQLSFGRVAKRLGIADRTVVYYFPTKDDLVGEVLVALGTQLQTALAGAFTSQSPDHQELARRAWPVLARDETAPTFALFFEAMGMAAAGREPYQTLAPLLLQAWVDWLTTFFEGSTAARRAEAQATVALIDGLLLVRQILGPKAAQQAAVALGIARR